MCLGRYANLLRIGQGLHENHPQRCPLKLKNSSRTSRRSLSRLDMLCSAAHLEKLGLLRLLVPKGESVVC